MLDWTVIFFFLSWDMIIMMRSLFKTIEKSKSLEIVHQLLGLKVITSSNTIRIIYQKFWFISILPTSSGNQQIYFDASFKQKLHWFWQYLDLQLTSVSRGRYVKMGKPATKTIRSVTDKLKRWQFTAVCIDLFVTITMQVAVLPTKPRINSDE